MVKDLCSPGRTYPVVGLASSLDCDEPVIVASDVRRVVGPGARIYWLPTDELLQALKAEIGTKLALSPGAARIWWPALTRRSDPGDHPLVVGLDSESPTHMLAEFARQFALSRPDVRREIRLIDDVRALAEHRQEEAEHQDRATAQGLRDAHVELHGEATRVEALEAELEHTKRQLDAALGASAHRTDIGVLVLGLDAGERGEVMSSFGENLNVLRARAGLTQWELAARCFLSADSVAALGDGSRLPGFLALLDLARALEVSVADLTDGISPPTRWATREQLRDLLAERPGQTGRTAQLVEASRLPPTYVTRALRYMRAYGEISSPKRAQWTLAPQQPTSHGKGR